MGNSISNHYKNERYKREKFISKYFDGDGKVIDSFIVDRKHKNGIERHDITDNGIVLVYNNESNVLITKLIANDWQIKRYYKNVGREPPSWLIYLAKYHRSLNYHYI